MIYFVLLDGVLSDGVFLRQVAGLFQIRNVYAHCCQIKLIVTNNDKKCKFIVSLLELYSSNEIAG